MFINEVDTGTKKKQYLSDVTRYVLLRYAAITSSWKIGFLCYDTLTLKCN